MTWLERTPPGETGLCVLRCGLWGYNSIGVVSGSEAVAVDPGITPDEIHEFRRVLKADGARRVTHVILTHSHHDHIRGWDQFPGATVVAPKLVAEKPESSQRRILAGKAKVDERLGVQDEAFSYPKVDVTFDVAHELPLGNITLDLRSLPGHSDCTSVVISKELRTLLSADYLVSPGLPYCRFEPAPFEAAHRRLAHWIQELGLERVIPAHNDLLDSQPGALTAIAEELTYFSALRRAITELRASGLTKDKLIRAAAERMAERRGVDLGPKARQDADNARRVALESP